MNAERSPFGDESFDVSMKVLHVSPAFYPATYWGGPIFSVYGLCNALARNPSCQIRVLTTDAAGPRLSERVDVTEIPTRYPAGYDVFFARRIFGKETSLGLLRRLWPMVRWADVVHLTAAYSFPTLPTLFICRVLGKPVVWSPRGSLQATQEWEGARRRTLKRLWEAVCNAVIGKGRCVLHVTSPEEAKDSAHRIRNAGVRIIPNGVDVPDEVPDRVWRPGGRTRLLFIGRLHPIKGVENLLQALARLPEDGFELRICGTGEPGYVSNLRQLAGKLGVIDRVTFSGHVDGNEKSRAFHNADVCIVSSFMENFGIVVAESLAHGVPVIASRGTPWGELEGRGCGLWIDNSPESLSQAIQAMRARDLVEMGRHGRRWMEESFGWDKIATQMDDVYESLLASNYK